MKRIRFTEEQIIAVLREHEAGMKTADLARKHGVSEATLYNWKAKYGGLDVSEAKRLKALEEENRKLKKLLAEQMLDAAARALRASIRRAGARSRTCLASRWHCSASSSGQAFRLLCGSTIERVCKVGSPPPRNIASTLANSSGVPSNNMARTGGHPLLRQGSPPSINEVTAGLTMPANQG